MLTSLIRRGGSSSSSTTPLLYFTFLLIMRLGKNHFSCFGQIYKSTSLVNQNNSCAFVVTRMLQRKPRRFMSTANDDMVPELPPISGKRLFLVRHGEVINPGGPGRSVYYGGADVPLSDLGKQEATAAAHFLKRYSLSKIASSPLSRAKYGANEVWKLQQVNGDSNSSDENDIVVLDGFTELARGTWYGKTKDEIGIENLEKFDACDESVTPEGGESFLDLKERVLKARDELLSLIPLSEAGVLVSHLQVTRCLLSDALNIPTPQMTTKIPIATASISCVDYEMDSENNIVKQVVHFQSFKPKAGLKASVDMAN